MSGPAAILIGPPGAGKSTVGPVLAERLGVTFLDTDAGIEAEAGKPVSDIFVEDGEDAFRVLERAAVARAVAGHPGVLGLGGGAVLDAGTQQLLAGHGAIPAVAAVQVGSDTYLFFEQGGSTALDGAIKLDGVSAATLSAGDFARP